MLAPPCGKSTVKLHVISEAMGSSMRMLYTGGCIDGVVLGSLMACICMYTRR